MPTTNIETLTLNSIVAELCFSGPPLAQGPLPAFFYFFTTATSTLVQPPHNQPVVALADKPVRCFSLTTPFHSDNLPDKSAMTRWAKAIENRDNFVEEWTDTTRQVIDALVLAGYVEPKKIAVSGLSRGAFLATHLASCDQRVQATVLFAPLTDLFSLEEFHELQDNDLANKLQLLSLVGKLAGRPLRAYIGNRDQRVGTERCCRFICQLADSCHKARMRPPPAELIVSPSIGFKGHGTSPSRFSEGARWALAQLTPTEAED